MTPARLSTRLASATSFTTLIFPMVIGARHESAFAKSESSGRLKALLDIASGMPAITVNSDDLNGDVAANCQKWHD